MLSKNTRMKKWLDRWIENDVRESCNGQPEEEKDEYKKWENVKISQSMDEQSKIYVMEI